MYLQNVASLKKWAQNCPQNLLSSTIIRLNLAGFFLRNDMTFEIIWPLHFIRFKVLGSWHLTIMQFYFYNKKNLVQISLKFLLDMISGMHSGAKKNLNSQLISGPSAGPKWFLTGPKLFWTDRNVFGLDQNIKFHFLHIHKVLSQSKII